MYSRSNFNAVVETQPAVSANEILFLFMCCAKNRHFCDSADRLVSDDFFDPISEVTLRYVWAAIKECWSMFNGVTTFVLLQRLEQQLVANGVMEPYRSQLLHPEGLCKSLTASELTGTDFTAGESVLTRLVEERGIIRPLYRTLSETNQAVPANVRHLVDDLGRRMRQLNSIGSIPIVAAAADFGAPIPPPMAFIATGIGWHDTMLRGQVRGTVNGLLGPTGGGKTTWAIHKAVASARVSYRDAIATSSVPELVVFVTGEESASEIRPRIQSVAFSIPRQKLEAMQNWSELTTAGMELQAYERRLDEERVWGPFGRQTIPQLEHMNESQRYQAGCIWLNPSLVILDLSGSAEFPDAGAGGVSEIADNIHKLATMRGQNIREVVIDWAGQFCERYQRANPSKTIEFRHLLNSFGHEVKEQISQKFNCVSWVTHQLRGAIGRYSPTKLMHHSEAQESAAFANHMAFCGCLGNVDNKTGVRLLNWSKTRYVRAEEVKPVSLRIHEQFCEMVDVTRQFTVDPLTNMITSTDDRQAIGGFDEDQSVGPTNLGAN